MNQSPPTPVLAAIGAVRTVNIAGPGQPETLRYFGVAHSGVTGQAHPTRAQAEADVLAWHQGKPVAYVRHAEMPPGYTARLLAARRLGWWGRLKARWRGPELV
jgi:hypothetical protein